MGKPAGVEIGASHAKDCGNCGMPLKEKKSCCESDVKLVKLQQDQSGATFAVFHFGIDAPALLHQTDHLFAALQKPTRLTPPAHAPPLLSRQDTYLVNRVFRI